MKVLQNTPDRLVVEHKPFWIAVFIVAFSLTVIAIGLLISLATWFGLLFVALGVIFGTVFSLIFVKRTQVIYNRASTTVELRRKSLQPFVRRGWDLPDFERAMVQTTTSDKGQTLSRPTLVVTGGMDAGKHPIVTAHISGSGSQKLVDAINTWRTAKP